MHVRPAVVTVLLWVLSACGSGSPASVAPSASMLSPASSPFVSIATAAPSATATAATTAAATSNAEVDLSALDACTLLDEQTLQELTGESLEFVTDQRDSGHCFWGIPRAGEPAYVEIDVFARPDGLSGYTFDPGPDCSIVPIAGVGTEAMGATCSDPQHKVYLLAWDRGVALRVLVNEPSRPLEPEDLAATVTSVLEQILAN